MTLVQQLEEAVGALHRMVVQLRSAGQYPAADRWIVRTRAVEEAVEKLKGQDSELSLITHHLSRSKLQGDVLSPSQAAEELVEHHNELVSEVALLRRSLGGS